MGDTLRAIRLTVTGNVGDNSLLFGRRLWWIVLADLRASGTGYGWIMGLGFSMKVLHAYWFDAVALSAYAAIEGRYGCKKDKYNLLNYRCLSMLSTRPFTNLK
jgi:hypothetical protein